MATLADALRASTDRPVVDKTGLTGQYDFTLEFAPNLPNVDQKGEPSDVPLLSVALRQQFGLELVSRKLPFDVLVIDGVDKLPAEN